MIQTFLFLDFTHCGKDHILFILVNFRMSLFVWHKLKENYLIYCLVILHVIKAVFSKIGDYSVSCKDSSWMRYMQDQGCLLRPMAQHNCTLSQNFILETNNSISLWCCDGRKENSLVVEKNYGETVKSVSIYATLVMKNV